MLSVCVVHTHYPMEDRDWAAVLCSATCYNSTVKAKGSFSAVRLYSPPLEGCAYYF